MGIRNPSSTGATMADDAAKTTISPTASVTFSFAIDVKGGA
jgi:hypothetical protein